MSDTTTRRMLSLYEQIATPVMFFTGLFQTPAENFYNGEEVEIDIIRSDEDISIAIQDLSTGYRMNSEDLYTNKSFVPPVHKEAIPLNSHELLKRMPGENPFQDPNYRANILTRLMRGMVKVEGKIKRAIEFQAAQVLQTGTVTLSDSGGNALYTIDYKPKATHFPTSSTTWGQAGDDKLGDIESLADVNRNDGFEDSDQIILGSSAWREFLKDTTVLAQLDNRRINIGGINRPDMRGQGGKYHGEITIGENVYQLWTYDGKYKDPQTGNKVRYLDEGKVIVRSSSGRLDATYGNIPNIGRELGVNGRLLPELPGRLSSTGGAIDLIPNAWITPDGEQLFAGVGSRPLLIPTAIDTYGCLNTGL